MRTTVVLTESTYETLKETAESEQRSTHRQIIYILERWAEERRRQSQEAGRGE